MKGYKSISNNIKNQNNGKNFQSPSRNASSFQRSDKSIKEQRSELIRKYTDSSKKA